MSQIDHQHFLQMEKVNQKESAHGVGAIVQWGGHMVHVGSLPGTTYGPRTQPGVNFGYRAWSKPGAPSGGTSHPNRKKSTSQAVDVGKCILALLLCRQFPQSLLLGSCQEESPELWTIFSDTLSFVLVPTVQPLHPGTWVWTEILVFFPWCIWCLKGFPALRQP